MSSKLLPTILIGLATLFVVMGDLRNLISPAGYWAVWSLWLVAGFLLTFFIVNKSSYFSVMGLAVPSVLCFGFFGLFVSFFVSAVINGDASTAYACMKFVAISLIGIFIFFYSKFLGRKDIYFISLSAIFISYVVFEFSNVFYVDWYVKLGDGRQGSIIAYPGVLWKAGAFFAPFLMAQFIQNRHSKTVPFLGITLAIYLVIQDGSRTGFLWMAFCFFSFLTLLAFSARRLRLLIVFLGGVSLFLVVVIAQLLLAYSLVPEFSLLAFDRLSEGDSIRGDMVSDGIIRAENCLPFGCGFGTAVSTTPDGPMVIHNAFLSSLGDVGVVGFLSLILVMVFPIYIAIKNWTCKRSRLDYFEVAAVMGVSGFVFLMFLHPFSTEMSEWGLYFIMVSWLLRCISLNGVR